jgi:hypothetical protein
MPSIFFFAGGGVVEADVEDDDDDCAAALAVDALASAVALELLPEFAGTVVLLAAVDAEVVDDELVAAASAAGLSFFFVSSVRPARLTVAQSSKAVNRAHVRKARPFITAS